MGDDTPPEQMLPASLMKGADANQSRPEVASNSGNAAYRNALSSSSASAISAVKAKLSPSAIGIIHNEAKTSCAPLRRCKKIKDVIFPQPDEIIVKDDAQSAVKVIDQTSNFATRSPPSSSSPSSASLSPPSVDDPENCNDETAATTTTTGSVPSFHDPRPHLDESRSVERSEDVEKRPGVSLDADKSITTTKRASSAAASIRNSISTLVGITASSSSSFALKQKSSRPLPPSSSNAASHITRSSAFKNSLPSLPIRPSPKTALHERNSTDAASSAGNERAIDEVSTFSQSGLEPAGKSSVKKRRETVGASGAATPPEVERVASALVWSESVERNLDETRC